MNQNGYKKKLMTAKEVQQEYLQMDLRKIRNFLNHYCSYKKIGRTYYYSRREVAELLSDEENSLEFPLEKY